MTLRGERPVDDGQPRLTTTFREAVDHFVARSPRAASIVDKWREDRRYNAAVVPFVSAFVASILYRTTPSQIEAVCRTTEHALGEVQRTVAESVEAIVDWNPDFALQHVLHHAAETLGTVPTFGDFREFVDKNAGAREMLLGPSKAAVANAVKAGASGAAASAAMKWRVGNAYLAFLKESYAISVLRASGIDARYHLVADVLFRVDAWVEGACLSLFVGNAKFRAGSSGRKPTSARLLGEDNFRHITLEMPTRREFGNVHLPDARALVELAKSRLSP